MASREELEAMGISNQKNINHNIENKNSNKKNPVSVGLKLMALLIVLIGVIAGILLFEDEFFIALPIFIGSLISGMLVEGLGEIIQKLQNIEDKIKS